MTRHGTGGGLRLLLTAPLFVILCSLSVGAQDSTCADCTCAGDSDADGAVTIDEVVAVVNNAVHGCSQFRWYLDCPHVHVRENHVCPSSTVFCTTEEVGTPCSDAGVRCCRLGSRCTGSQCNEPLVCTDKDPMETNQAICRLRSRRRFKHDIEYLAQSDLKRLRAKLLAMNLTRFRYNGEPSSTAPHLGFIIEDVEPSPSVDSQHDAVDLYGYLSMAVGTIQVQEGEIQTLRQEVDALRRQVGRLEDGSSQ